jgi:TatD DNase family protein
LIDFHCHLDLYSDPAAIAAKAENAQIYVLSVTTTPKSWRKTAALAMGKTYIRTSLGFHPQLAHERSDELPLFETLLEETRYVGEIGLDGSPDYRAHADSQTRVFERILAIVRERGGRILTIHSRRAAEEVIRALKQYECTQSAVLHWFSGSQRQLANAIAAGCWFSVGPAMLRSERGRQLTALMPRDRILTETDGPFGLNGDRPLEPPDVRIAEASLAKIWDVSAGEVSRTLRSNLKALLKIVPPTCGAIEPNAS